MSGVISTPSAAMGGEHTLSATTGTWVGGVAGGGGRGGGVLRVVVAFVLVTVTMVVVVLPQAPEAFRRARRHSPAATPTLDTSCGQRLSSADTAQSSSVSTFMHGQPGYTPTLVQTWPQETL